MAAVLNSDGTMANPAAMTMLLNSIGGIVQSNNPSAIKLSQLADVTKNLPPGISPDAATLLKFVNQKATTQLDAAINPSAANGNGTGQGEAVDGTSQSYSASDVVDAISNIPQSVTGQLSQSANQLKSTASDISAGINSAVVAISNYFD